MSRSRRPNDKLLKTYQTQQQSFVEELYRRCDKAEAHAKDVERQLAAVIGKYESLKKHLGMVEECLHEHKANASEFRDAAEFEARVSKSLLERMNDIYDMGNLDGLENVRCDYPCICNELKLARLAVEEEMDG